MVDTAEWVKRYYMGCHLGSLLRQNLYAGLGLSGSQEVVVVLLTQLLSSAVFSQCCFLTFLRLIVLDHLLELSHLIDAVLKENSAIFKLLPNALKLVCVFV